MIESATAERRHPTILDVASHAGVSKSTVSNVVRGLPGVSDATRRRVRAAIDELGYRPNVLARQLVQQRTSMLGVVVGDLANPFFAEMAKSVERHAAARGYTAMFCNTEGDSQSELAGVETLLQHRVAGIVFLAFSGDSRTMRETMQHQVPAVFVSCGADWGDVVSVDDELGGRLGTTHLVEAGHRRIAYLSIPELEDESDRARWAGYRAALKEAHLGPPLRISWSPPADHALVDGVERPLLDLFTGAGPVTAVFASNDVAAIALQEFADRVNLHVPKDLSIVGFDDVPMAGLARIGLTTVAQPRDELAKLGIATISDRIERRLKGPPTRKLVDVRLVARRSTAAPR
ncbi:MAG: LacI family transcriptional regulator [Chloroflexi bacterium]|nr:MAG: LacI family transcriptional regulator [Chloroflexota bacterium]